MAIVAISVWYLILGLEFESHQTTLPYFVTEWMITFSAGFVRRGILGQSFLSLGELLHTGPLNLILAARVAIAVAYLTTLGTQLFHRRRALGVLGICVILSNPLICFYAWFSLGSLDLLFLLITVFNLWLSLRAGESYWKWATLLFGTVGVFLVLSHEAFFFLGLPVNAVISFRALRGRPISKSAAIYTLPLLALVVASWFHGSAVQAAAIAQEWNRLGVKLPDGSAVEYIPQNLSGEVRYVFSMMTPLRVANWGLATITCIVPLGLLWHQFLKSASAENRKRLVCQGIDFVGIPILCTLPLYLIGTDWNRWLALPFATGTVCLLMAAPLDVPYEADGKMKFYLRALVLVSLLHTPTALYYSVGQAANGPLMTTELLLAGHSLGERHVKYADKRD